MDSDADKRHELRKRRATLNMRLGDYSSALTDAESLPEDDAEGLLLKAQARFVGAPKDWSNVKTALAEVERARKMTGGHRARALYLHGAYEHILAEMETKEDEDRRVENALRSLKAAVDEGFNSADAYYRLATVYLVRREDYANAIASASKALDASLTDEEIIVRFGGSQTVTGEAVRHLRRDIFLRRAQAHQMADSLRECIADSTEAIALDDRSAYAHLLRGFVRGELLQFTDAIADLQRCLELAPANSQDPVVRKTREGAVDLLRKYRGESGRKP